MSSSPGVAGSNAGGATVVAGANTSVPSASSSATPAPLKLAAASVKRLTASSAAASSSDSSTSSTPSDSSTSTPDPDSDSSGNAASIAHNTSAANANSAGHAAVHTLISPTNPTGGTPAAPAAPAAPKCPAAISGSTAGAPGDVSADNIPGTNSADINSFASEYDAIRTANCLTPIPFANIRFSSCLEQRLFWMADDPSTNPMSAWGHTGVAKRSDGVPIVGCDGDLAGGSGYTGANVASAWWDSADHKASLYQPLYKGSVANICVYFALTHGGYNVPAPNEPYSFTRAAAYWASC